jgi:hypothetical protein
MVYDASAERVQGELRFRRAISASPCETVSEVVEWKSDTCALPRSFFFHNNILNYYGSFNERSRMGSGGLGCYR